MERRVEKRTLPFTELTLEITRLGSDVHLLLYGGEKPHLGCCVLAIPRPSLTGDGISATASVLNVTGHKDEDLCRYLAETVASETGRTVVCTGGIHMDHITGGQIAAFREATSSLAREAVAFIRGVCYDSL